MEEPPSTGPPDSFFLAPSPKFTEDLRKYQEKRGSTWYDSTQPSKRRVVDSDEATGVVDVQTLTFCWHQRRFQTTRSWLTREEAAQAEQRTSKPTEAETSTPTKADPRNVPQDRCDEQEDCTELSKEVAEPSRKLSEAPSESQISS